MAQAFHFLSGIYNCSRFQSQEKNAETVVSQTPSFIRGKGISEDIIPIKKFETMVLVIWFPDDIAILAGEYDDIHRGTRSCIPAVIFIATSHKTQP